jgi:hypothetical protein
MQDIIYATPLSARGFHQAEEYFADVRLMSTLCPDVGDHRQLCIHGSPLKARSALGPTFA